MLVDNSKKLIDAESQYGDDFDSFTLACDVDFKHFTLRSWAPLRRPEV